MTMRMWQTRLRWRVDAVEDARNLLMLRWLVERCPDLWRDAQTDPHYRRATCREPGCWPEKPAFNNSLKATAE